MYTKATKFKSSFLFFVLVFLFVVLLIRLFYLQLSPSPLPFKDKQQYEFALCLKPQRGIIYDRKERKLAVSLTANSVYSFPKEIKDKNKTAAVLASILHLDKKTLLKKFSRKSFVWIKRKISSAEEKAIRDKFLKGIYFLPEEKRFYPQGELAAHIIGFCGIDNEGLEGIELFYDDYLRGREGWRFSEKDAHHSEIAAFEKQNIPLINGYNLLLTVDTVIQYIVEKELKKTVEECKPLAATVVVLDPQNGELLALANYPTYNPNFFSSFSTSSRRNQAVTDFFEPGSVFKIIAASAALEEKVAKLKDIFYCEKGRYCFRGHILHDYHAYGKLNFSQVIEKSSNIGISKIAQILGRERFYKYILKFGFASPTGVDLPGETQGLIMSPRNWQDISMLNIPMGQGIGVSSLQLGQAISVIASGGMLFQPHVVKEIRDKKGETIRSFSNSPRRIISKQTAQKMTEILQRVVEKGTAKNAKIKGYKIAGKTGTAQKVNPRGGYYKDKFIASFIGFLPADKPLLSIVVVIDHPQGKYFGGTVAAPLFQRIGKQVMEYLR